MEDERYTIERTEGGDIKNSLGQAVVYGYYDKVVFGDSEYLACNQVIEKKAAEFQSQYENLKEQVKEADGAKSDYREGEFPCYDTCEVQNISRIRRQIYSCPLIHYIFSYLPERSE